MDILFSNLINICLNASDDFSEINELLSPNCTKWGINSHPIDYAVDSDSSTFWLSRSDLPSVDLLFDLRGVYKVCIFYISAKHSMRFRRRHVGADLGLLAGGVSVSRSHMSFYLRTGGRGAERHMCRSTYRRVNISRLLILQSLH